MSLLVAKGGKPDIYIHDADLGDNGRVATPQLSAQTQPSTTFNDSGVTRRVGLKDISLAYEGLFDGASQKSHAALNDLRTNRRIVSVYYEGDTLGNEGIVLNSAHAETYESPVTVGELVPLNASIMQSGAEKEVVSLYAKPSAAITATANGSSVDNGASSSNGGSLIVHVFTFTASGGNAQWIAHIQESSDDGVGDAWADIDTITISAVGAQEVTWTGATERYLRVRWELDATSGSLLAQAGAHRG